MIFFSPYPGGYSSSWPIRDPEGYARYMEEYKIEMPKVHDKKCLSNYAKIYSGVIYNPPYTPFMRNNCICEKESHDKKVT